MRQTLFRIPVDGPWSLGPLGNVPGFGFGIVLVCWAIFGAAWLYLNRRWLAATTTRTGPALLGPATTWLVVAVGIVVLPSLVHWWKGLPAQVAQADQVLATNPRSVEALIARARARLSMCDYSGAVDDLRAAAKIEPHDAAVWDRLSWILATCPDAAVRDGASALTAAKKACELTSSENPEYLATLAAAYAESGDFTQAVATLRHALTMMGERYDARPADGRVMAEIAQMRRQLQAHEGGSPFRDRSAMTELPVFGFGAMLFLGFMAGVWTAGRRGARVGYSPEMMWDIGIWLFIAGVIGCRVFFCIQYRSQLFYTQDHGRAVLKSPRDLVFAAVDLPDGGLVYYGGIPAGLLAAAWICRRRGISLLELGDVVVPSLFLGMAFGRIGCFLNGCCYGDRCNLPWGVRFPMGSVPDEALVSRGFVGAAQDLTLRLHPTQLYSSLDGLFLFLLTSAYFAYRPRNGAVIALGALTYPLTRFAVESLRGDELGQFNTSLTISQWISILMFGVGLVFTAWLARQPKLLPRNAKPTTVRSAS